MVNVTTMLRSFASVFLLAITVIGPSLPAPAQAQNMRQTSASESAPVVSQPGRRVALLLGNSAYSKLKRLANPKNDVRLMEATLRELGFSEIIGGTQGGLDKTLGEMLELLDTFSKRTAGAEVAVIFFAGHGLVTKQGNEQYLAAVEASAIEARLPAEALSINQIMAKLSQSGAEKNFVFLDACRESARGGGMRSVVPSRDAPNTVILYATAADDLAADGKGANSPFTSALTTEIKVPNQEWAEVQRRVVDRVMQSTEEKQEPKAYGSLRKTMYFKVQIESGPSKLEETYWKSADQQKTIAAYEAYLKKYPEGEFAPLAVTAIASIRAPVTLANAPPPAVPPVPVLRPVAAQAAPAVAPTPPPAPVAPIDHALPAGSIFKDCADCPEMVVIPAGSFTMGSSAAEQALANEAGAAKNLTDRENPQHTVRVASFSLGKTEVTVAQFRRFVEAKNYQTDAERNLNATGCFAWLNSDGKFDWRADHSWRNPGWTVKDNEPVTCISHNDATAYVQWLSQSTRKTYQLPSEAQWEYAARAGSSTSRPWGDNSNDACKHANGTDQTKGPTGQSWSKIHECNDGYWFVAPVGNYQANAFGLHDMLGNVWEWTQDCWNASYQGAPTNGSAWTTGDCTRRVLRGGSLNDGPAYLRSAIRDGDTTDGRVTITGFRLARTLP